MAHAEHSSQLAETERSKVYSTQVVADILGVSKEHIHRQIRAGLMPHKRVGRRVVIPRKLFEDWLNQGEEV
jgi:excisionase family DNA binding protein